MSPLDRRSFLLATVAVPLATCASPAHATELAVRDKPRPPGRRPRVAAGIQPMTEVTQSPRAGYFSDPYPIPCPGCGVAAPAFSGSPKSVISPSGPFGPESYSFQSITVAVSDALVAEASAHGATFQPGATAPNVWSENNNIARDSDGTWQMATTLRVSNPAHPEKDFWTVIVHAGPVGPTSDAIPTSWTADVLLVGSYDDPVAANYCGKYVEDSGELYLTYSKRLLVEPNATNGIVAQRMLSATEVAGDDPVVLIRPEAADGGLKSELFFGLTQPPNFRVTETGNVVRIGDIYVMTYSAGAFDRLTYKTGLAFSDTFLPTAGSTYKKILEVDQAGVWGVAGRSEVRYLLQTQQSNWPNYVADQVLSPGVPSIRQVGSEWYLFFAAYDPDDAPILDGGTFDPTYRRPYFQRLDVDIPAGASVSGTSSYDLAGWIATASA